MSIIKRKAGSEDIVKSILEFDEVPTEGSPNLVESGAVAQAIGNLGNAVSEAIANAELAILSNIPPAANTLRFSFSKKDYDPTVAGVGSSGTWTKLATTQANVWDWTNTNTSWATAFGGGGTEIPGAFADYENNPVKVIAAGDTSTVTDFSRFFQNCYAITEICPIDTSNAANVFIMFSNCINCTKFPDMDFSSAIANNGVAGVYQSCDKMKIGPNIVFPSGDYYSLQNFFKGCISLETIPLYDTSYCNNMSAMFSCKTDSASKSIGYMHLKSVPNFDTSNVTNMSNMFRNNVDLESVPNFDTSKVTTMSNMFRCCSSLTSAPQFNTSAVKYFNSMFDGRIDDNCDEFVEMHIASVPDFDYSAGTRFDDFMVNDANLTEIPEINIEANVTRCDSMFERCPNIKSGQKALYDTLSAIATITNHTDCFKDCGSATEEGRAALAQIPQSWGGTMPNP